MSTGDSEEIAAKAFQTLAADPERLGRFLALTGLSPGSIREASRADGFLGSVLSYIVADEELLVAIASELSLAPERIAEAERRLAPPPFVEP